MSALDWDVEDWLFAKHEAETDVPGGGADEVTMSTEWRPIPGYEGRYEVSEDGQVRSFLDTQGRICSTPRTRALARVVGRLAVLLAERPQVTRMWLVHSLVAAAFIGPRPSGLTVNHKDGNKDNNHWTNLEYVTLKENRDHATANRFLAHGERVNTAKLTAELVRAIRADRASGLLLRELAAKYRIGVSQAHAIVTGRSWKHVRSAA